MGISDRDYMRDRIDPPRPAAPRRRYRKAGNTPPLWQRFRFWLWRMLRRG